MVSIINTLASSRSRDHEHRIVSVQSGERYALTLAEFDRQARCLAQHFRNEGLERGQRVGVFARNSLEWALIDLAAIKAGVKVAGFDPQGGWERYDLASAYDLKRVYTDRPGQVPGGLDIRTVRDVIVSVAEHEPAPIVYEPSDTVAVKFTSGSTGTPKGLEASVGSIDDSLNSVQQMFHHGAGDNVLVFLPMSLLQQRYWIYSALVFGHDVTLSSFEYVFATASALAPTVIMGVPGFYELTRNQILRQAPAAATDLSVRRQQIAKLLGDRLRYLWTGSAPASSDVLRFFHEADVPLFEGYGMNETCIVSKNYPGANRLGSVGKVLPNKRVRIDEHGLLRVGSEHPVNTRYAHCAEGDSERIFMPDGDVLTGDLARIDDDGYLYILGRADQVVTLSNGKTLQVKPIEDAIRASDAIEECVVCGVGPAALAAIVSPCLPTDRDAIGAHLRALNERLPKDQRLLETLIVDEPFSEQNGLLSSQYKPKRKAIIERYQPLAQTQMERRHG